METSKGRFEAWWRRALVVLAVIAVGWLALSPPTFSVDGPQPTVACKPIVGPLGSISALFGTSSSDWQTVDRLLADMGVKPGDELYSRLKDQVTAGLAQGCQEARLNRQTELILLLSVVLLIGAVLRRRPVPLDETLDTEA